MRCQLLLLFLVSFVSSHAIGQDSLNSPCDSIYNFVDTDPEFPGGMAEFVYFIQDNIHYPSVECVFGTIYIRFTVEKDGAITNAEIVRGLSNAYDQEVMRVISIMPKWTPGYLNNQPVCVAFTIPFRICA